MANTTGKKFGGRKKGTANKTTKQIRESIQKFISMNSDEFAQWLKDIPDRKERFDVVCKLAEYVLPKLQRTEHTGEDGGPVNFTLTDLFNASSKHQPK